MSNLSTITERFSRPWRIILSKHCIRVADNFLLSLYFPFALDLIFFLLFFPFYFFLWEQETRTTGSILTIFNREERGQSSVASPPPLLKKIEDEKLKCAAFFFFLSVEVRSGRIHGQPKFVWIRMSGFSPITFRRKIRSYRKFRPDRSSEEGSDDDI